MRRATNWDRETAEEEVFSAVEVAFDLLRRYADEEKDVFDTAESRANFITTCAALYLEALHMRCAEREAEEDGWE